MKYAVIARPPVVGGKVVSFDASDALKVPGVEKVIEVEGLAPAHEIPAARRRRGDRAQYRGGDQGARCAEDRVGRRAEKTYNSKCYRAELEERARKPGKSCATIGDIEAALKGGDKVVAAEYYVPHLAHASMEPPVALANFADGKVEVWAPVQSPGGTRDDLAKTLGMPVENVTVNVTLLGGGFGRKSKCDFALEAALLSRAVGAPVKVQWTREDDLRHDFLHTVSAERIEAGLDKNGKVVGVAAPQCGADHSFDLRAQIRA